MLFYQFGYTVLEVLSSLFLYHKLMSFRSLYHKLECMRCLEFIDKKRPIEAASFILLSMKCLNISLLSVLVIHSCSVSYKPETFLQ